jgi:hypothetical protein
VAHDRDVLQPDGVEKGGDRPGDGVGVVAELRIEDLGEALARRVQGEHRVALGEHRRHGVEGQPPTAAAWE